MHVGRAHLRSNVVDRRSDHRLVRQGITAYADTDVVMEGRLILGRYLSYIRDTLES
jgi:hypothetical protein